MKISQKFYYMPENPLYTQFVKEKQTLDKNLIEYPCSIYLDQATKAGICIYDSKKRLVTTLRIEKKTRTSIVEFRSEFRKQLQELIEEYKITKVFYEQVFLAGGVDSTFKLVSLRDLIVDIAYENGIKSYALQNMKWKARLAHPESFKSGIDHKVQIKMHVKKYYPLIDFGPDVDDAVGMAIAVLLKDDQSKPLTMSLDKRLRIDNDVKIETIDYAENLEEVLKNSKFKRRLGELDYKLFDYDITLDLMTNFRYILTNFDVIAVTQIPYHRYYGQILLDYDIRPSDISENELLLGIAVRK